MCTAILTKNYAGRTLDVDRKYGECIIITPRNYEFNFKRLDSIKTHFAIIGMGVINQNYPLYFDGANERGLYIAGLNYVDNAKYLPISRDKTNLAPYELIPYILSKCSTVAEAKKELRLVNLINVPFATDMPTAELHFFIADKSGSIIAEPDDDGLKIYENPVGVLTNNPPFPIQLFNLNNFMNLSNKAPVNCFSKKITLKAYSFGMGAMGLPGDLSSMSRFVKASFHRANLNEQGTLSEIMHLLSLVSMPDGSVKTDHGFERTEYTSSIDLSRLIYNYRTYDSPNTYAIKMSYEDLESDNLIYYNLKKEKEPLLCNSPQSYYKIK